MRLARPPLSATTAAGLLSFLLVPLTTAVLALVQAKLTVENGGHYVRPFGIGYIVPIALITAIGGYRPGLLALALSLVSTVVYLVPSRFDLLVDSPRDIAEMVFLALVGGLVVAGGEAMRRNVALLQETKAATERQRRFMRDVLASVTDNRLHLCDNRAELPPCRTPIGDPVPLSRQDVRSLRQRAREAAGEVGIAEERCLDLVTAVGEAAMNAVVHGGGGEGHVCFAEPGTVQVWVTDHGRGIAVDQLPAAALLRGHSTAGTLGHGFWLMLHTTDRLWLVTGEAGTTVVLEQDRTPLTPVWQ